PVSCDSIQEPSGGTSQFRVLQDILCRVERCAFLFPLMCRHTGALDLECQQIAFQPIEIRRERTNAIYRKHHAAETEHRTRVVPLMQATDEQADMTKLVQIRDIERALSARNTKARAFARASELEQARMRVRPAK